MKIRSIQDIDVKGKLVFLRSDFNVPLNDRYEITDDTGIKASLPTIRHLVENGARVVCASHLGRPNGKKTPGLSFRPVARRLSKLLGREVTFVDAVTGRKVDNAKAKMKAGDVILLRNLRFDPGETANDAEFARELAKGIDIFVNDTFGVSHREHASVVRITEFVPVSVGGLQLKKEVDFLNMAVVNPPKKFTVLLGGTRIADKIPLITNLLDKADKILIGGALAYTFLEAKGVPVGGSKVEKDYIPVCKDILKKAKEKGVRFILPVDHIAALTIEPEVTIRMIKKGEDIPQEMMGLDIGFDTIHLFCRELKDAQLIFWNGPMGVFEIDTFSAGSTEIAREIAGGSATAVIGGGDSVAAVNKAGVANQMAQVSAGGTGHTEAVKVVYEPEKVSYDTLLEVFWHNIDPVAVDR
ncbi:MAG: phosphoglycerate kinase, partial [bacterium]|nr:phosphoglycerate kinase [bacterium]